MKLALVCGRTGGHLFPAISVAVEWLGESDDRSVLFLGTASGIEGRIVGERGFPFFSLPGRARAGNRFQRVAGGVGGVTRAFFRARSLFIQESPDAVIAFGSYVAAGPTLAGWSMGVPVLLHESNVMPGVANRLLARFSGSVCVGFPPASTRFGSRKTAITGIPVREAPKREQMFFFRQQYGLDERRKVLLVMGGSQGAERLNAVIKETLGFLEDLAEELVIFHVTGRREEATEAAAGAFRKEVGFLEEVQAAMAAADLFLGRAGASTLGELAGAALPAILVPFPGATEAHQLENARYFSTRGAAVLIEEEELIPERVAEQIRRLVRDSKARLSMSEAMAKLARPDAAAEVVRNIEELIEKKRSREAENGGDPGNRESGTR